MTTGPSRKKSRISKHVLKSNEERGATPDKDSALPTPPHEQKKKGATPKKKSKKSKTKDPVETASYLSAWKHREAGGAWKFNKNTQSWLIRHMYETDKVAKATFEVMLEYLAGLPSNQKGRVIEVAEQRAVRYKDFEKTLNEKKDEAVKVAPETPKEEEKVDGDKSPAKSSELDGGEDDETRWKKLDEHEKRKEYKRARKILDSLQ
jgi:hypothetical protein